VLYMNDGDWVESCTALLEAPGGELILWQHGATVMSEVDDLVEIAA
jgi:hypothetical protein